VAARLDGPRPAPALRRGDHRCIADGRPPEIIAAFGLDRFGAGTLVGEKGAAAVGH